MSLLDEVIATYGGADRWQQVDTIKIHQIVGGTLWPLKGVDGIINDSTVEIRLKEERAWHRPLPKPGQWSSPKTAGLAHDLVSAAGTGASRCSSNAASLWSNSIPTLVIWGVLKLPNRVLGWSKVNHVAWSASSTMAVRSGA